MTIHRRRFLRLCGAAGISVIAGCSDGSENDSTSGDTENCELITEQQPTTPNPTSTSYTKLSADDSDDSDRFGYSVAISSDGTTGLIGAFNDENSNGESAGSAYIFDNSGNAWNQQVKLIPDDGGSGDLFGYSVSISSDGTIALIGAKDAQDPNGNYTPQDKAGSAYVFTNSDNSWAQQSKLTADDGDSLDRFGYSVAVSGDGTTALIGAKDDEDPGGFDTGSAYVFRRSGSSWTQEAKLTAEDGNRQDLFGSSVALSSDGNTAIIAAKHDEDPNGDRSGSVYVFSDSGDSWSQQAKLTPEDGDKNDRFGFSIAISDTGSTALIGARDDGDPNGDDAGSAYVFTYSNDSWSQQTKVTAEDGDSLDQFGYSVAMSSDGATALIGANEDEDPFGGTAYLFENSDGSWRQQDKLAREDGDNENRFGASVAVSKDGTTALIGDSPSENPTMGGQEVRDNPGSAFVFTL